MRPLFAVQLLAGVTCVMTFLIGAGILFSAVVSANAISRFSFSEVELQAFSSRSNGRRVRCFVARN